MATRRQICFFLFTSRHYKINHGCPSHVRTYSLNHLGWEHLQIYMFISSRPSFWWNNEPVCGLPDFKLQVGGLTWHNRMLHYTNKMKHYICPHGKLDVRETWPTLADCCAWHTPFLVIAHTRKEAVGRMSEFIPTQLLCQCSHLRQHMCIYLCPCTWIHTLQWTVVWRDGT